MFTKSAASKRVLSLAVILLTLSMMSSFATVRSVRSRKLLDDPEVLTSQYAKMSPATFLNNPVLNVTIVNDNTGEAELKVEFTVDIDVLNNDDIEWDGEMAINLYPTLDAGETMVIDNTTILQELDNYMDFGFDGFTGDFGESHATSPGGLDFGEMDELGSFISDVLNLPEGTYTIAFSISEKDPEIVDDDFSIERGDTSVSFKVADIGPISITGTPEIDDLTVSWDLPMIPDYADTRVTRSVFTIEGDDVDFTKTITHDAPPGTEFKDYPSDTDEGATSYDLTSDNLTFRAGQTYTVTLNYQDWNAAEIAGEKVTTFTLPQAMVTYTEIGDESGLTPELSWSFGEYDTDEWVDSYDVFLNGKWIDTTEDTSYELTAEHGLKYNTTYYWYVRPRYASDYSRYDLGSNLSSFRTISHDSPAVSFGNLTESGNLMFKGESYDFIIDTETYNDTTIESVLWTIGDERFSGESITYTPKKVVDPLFISCTITDSAGYTSTTETVQARVVEVPNDFNLVVPDSPVLVDEEITVELTEYANKTLPDYITVNLNIDDVEFMDPSVTYTFDEDGDYSIEAFVVYTDSFGNELVLQETAEVEVILLDESFTEEGGEADQGSYDPDDPDAILTPPETDHAYDGVAAVHADAAYAAYIEANYHANLAKSSANAIASAYASYTAYVEAARLAADDASVAAREAMIAASKAKTAKENAKEAKKKGDIDAELRAINVAEAGAEEARKARDDAAKAASDAKAALNKAAEDAGSNKVNVRLSHDNIYNGQPVTASLDGEVSSSIKWYLDGNLIDTDRSREGEMSFTPQTTGLHEISLVFANGETKTVTFSSFPAPDLKIVAPLAGISIDPSESLPFIGMLVDSGSSALLNRYYWTLDGEELPNSNNPAYEHYEWTPGDHEIQFWAVDIYGKEYGSDIISINVQGSVFTGGRFIKVDRERVSTVILFKGVGNVAFGESKKDISYRTIFYEGDVMTIDTETIMLLNLVTEKIVMLQPGSYVWDADVHAWIEQE